MALSTLAGDIQTSPSKNIQEHSSSFLDTSRVRSHKGNIPSLPQTKQCSMCPAKFTRTTHLNRHIRSHTNERQHQCDICQSQFTRSDLLTRHKRTCGDHSNVYRSRRKSCQACAESKIRCDLEFPCSKCVSRGKECIFVNDPEASKAKRLAAAEKAKRNKSGQSSGPVYSKRRSASITSLSQQQPIPELQLSQDMSLFPSPSSSRRGSLDVPGLSFDSSSSSSSSAPSPSANDFDLMTNALGPSHLTQTLSADDAMSLTAHLKALLPPSSPDSLLKSNPYDDQLSSLLPQYSALANYQPEDLTWLGTPGDLNIDGCVFQNDFQFGVNSCGLLPNEQFFGSDYPGILPTTTIQSAPDFASSGLSSNNSFNTPPQLAETVLGGSSAEYMDPPAAELQNYLYLFFSEFTTQVPLIHFPTWQIEGKPVVLIRAMQACGALFARTAVAENFILHTLGCTRDILMLEFAKTPTDSPEYLALVIAVVLLQTIGLFHQNPEIRSASNVYHGMLVMMIRRAGLINRISNWCVPEMVQDSDSDAAWAEWCTYETAKRTLIFAYLHDCLHCVLFSIAPSFRPCEFDIGLPCDDSLWQASSSAEWFSRIQNNVGAGIQATLIRGVGMQAALAYLNHNTSNAAAVPPPPSLNAFGYFVLIQTVLRNLYECQTSESSMSSTSNMAGIESALRNWLHAWLSYESTFSSCSKFSEPSFTQNAMPFFWLAQISLLEERENQSSTIFNGGFNHVSRWVYAIRDFIRKGSFEPEIIWEQLMSIRTRGIDLESHFNQADGLLGFFSIY